MKVNQSPSLSSRLKKIGIEQLVDVREIPLSRKNGFAKNALKKALDNNGIIYKHLPELGSPNANKT